MLTHDRLAILASALTDMPRQAPLLARQLGFNGLLFDAFSLQLNLPDLSASGRREFLHILAGQNQPLLGLRVELGPKGIGPGADVDQILARLDRVMEAAAALQAPLVCLNVGPLPAPPRQKRPIPTISPEQAGLIILPPTFSAAPAEETFHAHVPEQLDPVFAAQVDAVLMDLGARADRYSVAVAFRSDLASFAAIERALQQARCPWFGIDLDPAAILRDDWTMDQVFTRLGMLIQHVRGRDAVKGADRRTQSTVIGHGDTHWAEFLADLDHAGYRGWLTLDPSDLPDRPAAALAGLQHLRRLTA